ncbi:hypothetical protein VP01_310g6 [Puccinia sorghi]|uniref:Uncharacterized protein n=1 Tax=Puccinia sorghi TaxID=27349 RepID=A0A0L6UZD5_9BASI|nr:hypothetical protein VP01_310g6 [Puccinia sorghi]
MTEAVEDLELKRSEQDLERHERVEPEEDKETAAEEKHITQRFPLLNTFFLQSNFPSLQLHCLTVSINFPQLHCLIISTPSSCLLKTTAPLSPQHQHFCAFLFFVNPFFFHYQCLCSSCLCHLLLYLSSSCSHKYCPSQWYASFLDLFIIKILLSSLFSSFPSNCFLFFRDLLWLNKLLFFPLNHYSTSLFLLTGRSGQVQILGPLTLLPPYYFPSFSSSHNYFPRPLLQILNSPYMATNRFPVVVIPLFQSWLRQKFPRNDSYSYGQVEARPNNLNMSLQALFLFWRLFIGICYVQGLECRLLTGGCTKAQRLKITPRYQGLKLEVLT